MGKNALGLLDEGRTAWNPPARGRVEPWTRRESQRRARADALTIGLVNNMPDAALEQTERQFRALLAAAAGAVPLRLALFTLPDVPRDEVARARLAGYAPFGTITTAGLDALVVTGTEPRAADLRDEPYWDTLTGLLDWAEASGVPTVLSCLAAHAAVLHADGIARVRLPEKRFGVFAHETVQRHPLTCGLAAGFAAPHSRWNEVSEAALAACGWQVLTRSAEAGPDLFVRQRRSLTVCFQGHPEYEPDTLLREYKRDVRRFLAGTRADYPPLPRGAVAPDAWPALAAFRDRAQASRDAALMAAFPPLASPPWHGAAPWRAAAATVWGNVLAWVREAAAHHV